MKISAIILSLLAVKMVGAPPPKLVREIGLDQIIPGHPEYTSVSLTFSPNDNWIAMVGAQTHFDWRGRSLQVSPGSGSGIFLVPRDGPMDQRIQTEPGLDLSGGTGWSPNSDSFFVQGITSDPRSPTARWTAKLFNLRGEELSHYGFQRRAGMLGFVDAEHLLAGGPPAKGVQTMDLHGQVVNTWTAPKKWRVVDISPDRQLLAVLSDNEGTKTLVVDYRSKKVILSKDNLYHDLDRDRDAAQTTQYFTEGGKTLCSVGNLQLGETVAPECWDVDSGKSIAKFDGIRGGAPASASPRGSRLILTRNTQLHAFGSSGLLGLEYVVWDFRAGKQLAA